MQLLYGYFLVFELMSVALLACLMRIYFGSQCRVYTTDLFL